MHHFTFCQESSVLKYIKFLWQYMSMFLVNAEKKQLFKNIEKVTCGF